MFWNSEKTDLTRSVVRHVLALREDRVYLQTRPVAEHVLALWEDRLLDLTEQTCC